MSILFFYEPNNKFINIMEVIIKHKLCSIQAPNRVYEEKASLYFLQNNTS